MLANMTQAETDRHNTEHCKRIAEEIERYAAGNIYKCPECGEVFEYDADAYNEETNQYTCPCCKQPVEWDNMEPQTVLDYFEDALDIEYHIGGDRKYRSVEIMVAWGGPNIYIDTATEKVKLYWWTDRAEYPISRDACIAIDDEFEQLYECY